MLLVLIGVVFVLRTSSAQQCVPEIDQPNVPTAPTLTLRLSSTEYPDEIVVTTGVNVTIVCISNASKENDGSAYNGQPYWIQFYFNDDFMPVKQCGGHENDNEDSKVCKYSIQSASRKDFGTYTCISHNQITCTEDTITVDFPGENTTQTSQTVKSNNLAGAFKPGLISTYFGSQLLLWLFYLLR